MGKVQAAIEAVTEPMMQAADVKAEEIIAEYRALAFARVTDVVEWDHDGPARIIPSDELSPEAASAIRHIEITEKIDRHDEDLRKRKIKVKMHKKEKALERLGAYLGLFKDPADLKVQVFQMFAELPPEELAQIENMEDEEIIELLESGGTWKVPGAGS